jgi:hypothetical protein
MGTLHEDQHTFVIISLSLLRVRNVSGRRCRETSNTQFVFNNFIHKNRAVYEIIWKNRVKSDSSQII